MNKINKFLSREALDLQLAKQVASQLQQAIEQNGKASIAFSGGSTPKGFFNELSRIKIDWQKVTVTLADDRWLDGAHHDSNARLIRENLLVNCASDANFFLLAQNGEFNSDLLTQLNLQAKALLPFDVVILGMGEDGHTASIFPCSEQVEQGLDANASPALIKVIPTTAPYDRISFNFNALITATNLYLHIVGDAKMAVLNDALASNDSIKMPIRAFLQQPDKVCEVFWAN